MEARVHPLVPAVPGGVDHPALRAGEAEERGLAQVEVRLGQGPLFLFARRRRRRRRGGRGRLLGRRRRRRCRKRRNRACAPRFLPVVLALGGSLCFLPPRVRDSRSIACSCCCRCCRRFLDQGLRRRRAQKRRRRNRNVVFSFIVGDDVDAFLSLLRLDLFLLD